VLFIYTAELGYSYTTVIQQFISILELEMTDHTIPT